MSENEEFDEIEPIAIIGASCRFPQADNLDAFWMNLCHGVESVTSFTEEDLVRSKVPPEIYNDPNYVNAGCVLDDIDKFDADFFGYSMDVAELIDPQQRLFLECAYEAVEDSGYAVETLEGITGVFGGTRTSSYSRLLAPVLSQIGSSKAFEAVLGNTVDQACLRISYGLNLKGPSIGVQTVCSSSIVAVHLACESLQNGECDLALAGASAVNVPHRQGFIYDKDMVLSPDGHCRAFDMKAQGSVVGNGLGFVVLKRYSEALEDKDQIYAVIKSTAINNDGGSKIGYRAPSIEGQASVINDAIILSGIDPETISYIEANGTGTFHGDSVEVEALSRVFRQATEKKGFCGIGAVKTNIGHLTHAAGIAGLIKTILSLKYKKIPPSLNYETPNPQLNNSPFYVVKELTDWEKNGYPRRAGVNAFAIGGSNAHVVLEEGPGIEAVSENEEKEFNILTISAKSEKGLIELAKKYEIFLKNHEEDSIENICYTSNIGRYHFQYRLAFVTDSVKDLSLQISDFLNKSQDEKEILSNRDIPKIGFILNEKLEEISSNYSFLYKSCKVFNECINLCLDKLNKNHDFSFHDFFKEDFSENQLKNSSTKNFIIQYSTASMWESLGIKPLGLMGKGSGFFTAGCLAGYLSVDEGLRLSLLLDEYLNNDMRNDVKIFVSEKIKEINGLEKAQIKLNSFYTGAVENIQEAIWAEFGKEVIDYEKNQEKIELFIKENNIDFALSIGNKTLHSNKKIQLNDSLRQEETYFYGVLQNLAELYVHGADINWENFCNNRFHRTSIPTYPFEKKSCWFKG